jgi:hypothetical protein
MYIGLPWRLPWSKCRKYGIMDPKEITVKLDVVNQELEQWVQLYYDMLEKLFIRGKIKEIEERWRFLSNLKL